MEQLPTTIDDKYQIVLNNNTYYFSNPAYEEDNEANILQLSELIASLKRSVDTDGLKKELLVDFIQHHNQGLKALLTITGISKEYLLRLITFVRIVDDTSLIRALKRSEWAGDLFDKEWTEKQIIRLCRTNRVFAECVVTLFFEGATFDVLKEVLPLFELKKLSAAKLKLTFEALIDTIVRYNVRGAYKANKLNNPEIRLEALLMKHEYEYEKGRLRNVGRTMDFIIPDKARPKVIVESSYVVTTSSGMGDKARSEIAVGEQIRRLYSYATFVGFVDGIGWLARQNDLKLLLSAFDNVFTYAPNELDRFIEFLNDVFGR